MGSELTLRDDDESLIRSCLVANEDPDVKLLEQEWNEICDVILEPWGGQV